MPHSVYSRQTQALLRRFGYLMGLHDAKTRKLMMLAIKAGTLAGEEQARAMSSVFQPRRRR